MLGERRAHDDAARQASGILPRSQIADFPFAARGAAGLAPQPRFVSVLYVACKEVAAAGSILALGRGQRRDGAARSGLGIFPGHAGVFAALGQDLAQGGAGDGQIRLGRRFRSGLRYGRAQRADLLGVVLLRQRIVELIGKAAAARRERQRSRRQATHQRVPSAGRCSITGPSQQRARHQRHDGVLRRMSAPIEHPSRLPSGDLAEEDEPLRLFTTWFEEASRTEPRDPTAMSLATIDADGLPNVRMVLMKGFDERGFVFFTNVDSQKGQELDRTGKAALLFHWKTVNRQVRLRGPVERVEDAAADAYFATRPRLTQIG